MKIEVDSYDDAIETAYRSLERSTKTEKQMRTYLKDKGFIEEVIFAVIEKLKEYNYIDDEKYAMNYCENYKLGKGIRRLAYELKEKGINDCIIENATEINKDDELNRAIELAKKRVKGVLTEDAKAKLYRFLIYRGFDYEITKTAIRQIESTT
ncbi:MAG: regulatory protein RecX [Clostridia bacterium]